MSSLFRHFFFHICICFWYYFTSWKFFTPAWSIYIYIYRYYKYISTLRNKLYIILQWMTASQAFKTLLVIPADLSIISVIWWLNLVILIWFTFHSFVRFTKWLVSWILWHINFCRLFNAKSIFKQIISSISNNSV